MYVDIPAGIDNNEIIIMRNKGNILSQDCQGDIKLFIKITNDCKHMVRHGMDLVFEKNITLKEAALKLKLVTGKEFDKIVDPKKMI